MNDRLEPIELSGVVDANRRTEPSVDESARKRKRLSLPWKAGDDTQKHEHSQSLMTTLSSAPPSEKSVAPFLTRHMRNHRATLNNYPSDKAGNVQIAGRKRQREDDQEEGKDEGQAGSSTQFASSLPATNTRYCYRHDPMYSCRRAADEHAMDELQRELHTLPVSDQQSMAHFWSLFSAAPTKHRNLMLQGILSQCCFPQLSYLAGVIKDLIRIDFLAALPNEISFQILSYLDTTSLCKASQVCRTWKALADDDVVWHRMCEQHIDRKCKKCGWGLPLLERKRLRDCKKAMEIRAAVMSQQDRTGAQITPRIAATSLSSPIPAPEVSVVNSKTPFQSESDATSTTMPAVSTLQISPQQCTADMLARTTDEAYFKCRYRPWKEVYRDRFKVGINWKRGRCATRVFRGHTSGVMALQFDDALNILATGSYDTTVKIWNLETGEEMKTLRGHAAGIRCLQFDERKLISGSLDCTVKVWNWRTGECISTFAGHQGGVISLNFDSTILLSGSMDHTVKIWNFEDRSVRNLRGHSDYVNSVRIDTPSRTVFTASDDLTAKLWDLDTGCVIQCFEGHVGQVQQILPLPREFEFEEHDAECADGKDDNISVASGPSESSHGSGDSHTNLNAASPSYAAVFFNRAICCPYSVAEQIQKEQRPEPPRYVITAALDSTMRLWHVPTGRCLRTFFGHVEGVWAMGADTLRLVSGSEDRLAKIWDPRTGQCEKTFSGHLGPVTCVGLSDERFATGSEDGDVKLYDFRCESNECEEKRAASLPMSV